MTFYLFVGTDHQLAVPEVEAVFPQAKHIKSGLITIDSDNESDVVATVSTLGSALKLARLVGEYNDDPSVIASLVTEPNFSISYYPTNHHLALKIAKDIKEIKGNKFRFVMGDQMYGASPLLIRRQKISEFIIMDNQLLQTVWVFDVEDWIKKDRQLPFANAHAGLLPPKVARVLINLSKVKPSKGKTLLDPFCGSGRVLIEGVQLGFNVIGSDILAEQVSQSQANIKYLGMEDNAKVFQSDAAKLENLIEKNSIDLIVTEPFLGKPNPRSDRVPDIVKGLKKLYLGALKSWLQLLKNDGVIVMIFPQISDGKRTYKTSSAVDDPHLLGYNLELRDLIYSRPDATVKREIVILKKSA